MSVRIHIAAPCHVKWADMTGDARKRLCALCNKRVYNLDGLSTAQVTALLDDDAVQCVRFFRRADGTVLTEDCPLGVLRRAKRIARRAWWAVAGAIAALLGTAQLATMHGAVTGALPGDESKQVWTLEVVNREVDDSPREPPAAEPRSTRRRSR